MLNLKQVVLSVQSDFNSKNRRKLAGKFTKYQLALLLFFVVSTGVIYVGSITAPGQISPALAGNTIDTSQMLSGQPIGLTLKKLRYSIDVHCSQLGPAYDDGKGGVRLQSYDKAGNLLAEIRMHYGDQTRLLVEAGGTYKIQPIDSFGKFVGRAVKGFFEHAHW